MREIKFRAIPVGEKEFIFREGFIKHYNGIIVMAYEEYPDGFKTNPVIPETLGQFTGLKDKNGTECYQDDIISDGLKKYQIHFFKGMFVAVQIGLEVIEENAYYRIDYLIDVCKCVVVGNIHQNPHIL